MNRTMMIIVLASLTCGVSICQEQATQPAVVNASYTEQANPAPQQPGPVKGAPYTGKRILESTGTLRDGTYVDQVNTLIMSRDSEGRMRMENDNTIQIQDPIAHVSYILDKKVHIARMAPRSTATPEQIQAAAQAELELEQARKITRESLGSKMMEGLLVEGTRTTETRAYGGLATGPMIKIVEEHWYSQELKLDIMTTIDDPRQITQMTSRLTEIQLGEPDPALFQVPPDYTIKDPKKQ